MICVKNVGYVSLLLGKNLYYGIRMVIGELNAQVVEEEQNGAKLKIKLLCCTKSNFDKGAQL